MSEEERTAGMRRLKAGVVALVGVSGGLVAVYGDAGPLGIAVAVAAGLVVGALLTWYIVWILR